MTPVNTCEAYDWYDYCQESEDYDRCQDPAVAKTRWKRLGAQPPVAVCERHKRIADANGGNPHTYRYRPIGQG